ncbi:MAG: hypothetical protein NTY05_03885 [Rhodocyclales bacterium]|nr:hypothetical protein [Rhodocyclales bacterium]
MSEQIFAAVIRGNKAKTFGVVEPLNSTSCHVTFSLIKNERIGHRCGLQNTAPRPGHV